MAVTRKRTRRVARISSRPIFIKIRQAVAVGIVSRERMVASLPGRMTKVFLHPPIGNAVTVGIQGAVTVMMPDALVAL
jgi:hypothetical protein